MVRKIGCFIVAGALILTGTACSNMARSAAEQQKAKTVSVIELKEENVPVEEQYTGTIGIRETKKYSFKAGGKISSIYVEKGQEVRKGQKLAQLDTKDLAYAVEAARSQMAAAQAQYEKAINGAADEDISKAELNVKKAQDAYNYSRDMHDKTAALFQQGAASRDALDRAKLDLDIRTSELEQAKEIEKEVKRGAREEDRQALASQLESARINYESRKSMLEDAVITADTDGYVVDVLGKAGEMIGAGYPVLVVRNNQQIVNAGLSQKDAGKINDRTKVRVEVDGKSIQGRVSRIDHIPDRQTWTYNAEIELPESVFTIGSIVRVYFEVQTVKGIWIPITSVLTNGEDYVYVVNDGKAVRKNINLGSVKGSKVEARGLETGEKLVIGGNRRLRNGDLVVSKPEEGK